MGSNSYIPEYISASRIVAHGKIESLANGFSLPNKEGFTIYARPKVGAEIATPDIVLSVKCMTDDKAAETPVRLNEWNKLYLESIAPNADILESVDLYWGAGFNIVKGKGKYYTEPTAVSTRYSGEAQALVTAGSGTGVVKYRLKGGEWSDSVPTATNVGVYQVEYKMEANDLYEGIEPKTLRCTIAEKFINDPTIELTPSSFTYNGSPCVPSVVVKDGQRVIPTAEYTVEITNNINAGTANVVIKDNIAGNYEVIGSTTFNIAKAARTISFVSVPSTLDEEETAVIAATPSAGANDGTISYSSSDSDVLSVDGNVVTAVASGNATLTAAISEGQNYLGASVTHEVEVKGFVALPYLTFKPVEDSTFGFSKAGLSYSLDEGRHWTELAANGTTPTVAVGKKIMWKNNTTLTPTSNNGIGKFTSSANFDVDGNIMSLLYGDNFVGQTSLSGKSYAFCSLFEDSKVRNAENLVLPATTLANYCYSGMFYRCSRLTTAPELPATTLANYCYDGMFYGCTRLSYVKMLATDISASGCLQNWLYNVSATGTFVKADGVEIHSGSSGIPSGWTVYTNNSIAYLTFVPVEDSTFGFSKAGLSYSLDDGDTWTELAADGTTPTVTAGNKIMWKNNTTLTPSSSTGIGTFTSSKNFDVEGNIMSLHFGDDFVGQTSLSGKSYAFCSLFEDSKVRNAENLVLPATTLANNCYQNMFSGCISLTAAPELPATTLANHCYDNMLSACTSLTTAPELPATTLKDDCYSGMFYRCSRLTNAPVLPATTLANSCYSGMFYGCSRLSYVKMLATDISAYYCLSNWLDGVSATGTFVKEDGAELPSGVSGIPEGWTVEIDGDKPWKKLISFENTAFGGMYTPKEGTDYIFSINRNNRNTRRAVLSTVNPYNFTWAEYGGGEFGMSSAELIAANVYPVIIPRSYIGKTLTQTIQNPNDVYGRWGLSFKGLTRNGYTTSQNTYDSGWQQFSTTTLSVTITSSMFEGNDYIALGTTFAPSSDSSSFTAQHYEVMDTLEVTIE